MVDINRIIDKNIDKAFTMARSQIVPVTLHIKEGESFNFNTRRTVISNEADVPTEGFIIKTERKAETTRMQVLIKKVEQLDQYDKATLKGAQWSISNVILQAEKVQIIEVFSG